MGPPSTVTCQHHWTGKQGRSLPAFTPILLAQEDSRGRNTQKEGTGRGETVGILGSQAESLALEITPSGFIIATGQRDRETATGQGSTNWNEFCSSLSTGLTSSWDTVQGLWWLRAKPVVSSPRCGCVLDRADTYFLVTIEHALGLGLARVGFWILSDPNSNYGSQRAQKSGRETLQDFS